MAKSIKQFKIRLNSLDELQALLQELYDETCMNLIEIQSEIAKLTQSTDLSLETMDGKAKYAKAINDFSTNKNKALSTKMDVAKMMVEVLKYNGNAKNAMKSVAEIPDNWGEAMKDGLIGASNDTPKEEDKRIYAL